MSLKIWCKISFFMLLALSAYGSLTPIDHAVVHLFWDKLKHFWGYFMLYAFLDLGFATSKNLTTKVLLILSYSVLLEILQHFIPNRQFSLLDILANFLGIMAYLAVRPALCKAGFYQKLKAIH